MFNRGVGQVQTDLKKNGNLPAEFNVNLITAFKVEGYVAPSYATDNGGKIGGNVGGKNGGDVPSLSPALSQVLSQDLSQDEERMLVLMESIRFGQCLLLSFRSATPSLQESNRH